MTDTDHDDEDHEDAGDDAGFQPMVDGGDLPRFEPTFELVTWDTPEGTVIGVPYEGADVPTPAQRVAYVRAAMEVHGP